MNAPVTIFAFTVLILGTTRSLGDDAVFTSDGQRIPAIADSDNKPALEEIDPFSCYIQWDCVLTTEHPRSSIDDVFIFVLDDMELRVDEVEVVLQVETRGPAHCAHVKDTLRTAGYDLVFS